MDACESNALRVGSSYIYVDWRVCTGCLKCVKACDSEAIRPRGTPSPPQDARPVTRRAATPAPETRPASRSGAGADPTEWSLLEALLLIAALFVTFLGKDAVMTSGFVRGLDAGATVLIRAATLFGFYALQLGTLVVLARRRGVRFSDAYRVSPMSVTWRERLSSAALVAGLLVVVRIGGWVYGLTAQSLGWDPPVREVSDLTEVFGPTIWGLLLSVVLVVVAAPVIEEVVFRGVIQGAFVSRWGSRAGIGLAAGIFALYHFTLWLFVPLFALGVACGWLAHTRRSLYPAISLHGAYNVVPVLMAFYLVW